MEKASDISIVRRSFKIQWYLGEFELTKTGDKIELETKFLTIWSPLNMMKNAFYFMLKALFVLEIFPFLSCLFGYVEKWLDKKS